jgi:hypothetical protein
MYANLPEGASVSELELMPVETLETNARAPVALSMAKTETLLEAVFVTYANRPWESILIEVGPADVSTFGASGVSAPEAWSIENTVISFDPKSDTYANLPEG